MRLFDTSWYFRELNSVSTSSLIQVLSQALNISPDYLLQACYATHGSSRYIAVKLHPDIIHLVFEQNPTSTHLLHQSSILCFDIQLFATSGNHFTSCTVKPVDNDLLQLQRLTSEINLETVDYSMN